MSNLITSLAFSALLALFAIAACIQTIVANEPLSISSMVNFMIPVLGLIALIIGACVFYLKRHNNG